MDRNGRSVWADFTDVNLAYVVELYDRFQREPGSVEDAVRAFFERYGAPSRPSATMPSETAITEPAGEKIFSCSPYCDSIALATAIRAYGYRAAQLDPIGTPPPGDPELLPETYGLSAADLASMPASVVGGVLAEQAANALAAIQALRGAYQGTTGYEFAHLSNAEQRSWFRLVIESAQYRSPKDPIDERRLLERLTEVEAFERFLQTSFPTQTRFSLEGLDTLVPMLDEVIGAAAELGTQSVMLGMAHRGRLNVLAHILGMSYEEIIAEFQGSLQRPGFTSSDSNDRGWTGDVKYHLGARRAFRGGREVAMQVALAPNPSHLEFIDPVVEGMARALSERRDQQGPVKLDPVASLAVLIHGDAAFPGEGIVAETLNLSRLPGYTTGGTLHLVANNQIGFSTLPESGRSTAFASDLAKGYEMPIIHVNADDPEACVAAARLAHAYVEEFHKDAVIDLIGYRRLGHNEGDDPSFTQPKLYEVIAAHPRVRELFAQELERRGVVIGAETEQMMTAAMDRLKAARLAAPKSVNPPPEVEGEVAGLEAGGTAGGLGESGRAPVVQTAVSDDRLIQFNEELLALPSGFQPHPKLQSIYERRRRALQEASNDDGKSAVDWGQAESLALASILADGRPIRLTGQDSARGTFSQRHLILHDFATGSTYNILQSIPSARASFEIWDSPLSEQATLGFECGYNTLAQEALALWEAQYGDFVNAAQVIIDEFFSSARAKWDQRPSLVLLLPHGYEGQGPDHSSARMERFLKLAAEDNLRIANCTTAGQYFHILRRQALLLRDDPRPLVLFTPKSLLRHPLAMASLADLAAGRFEPLIDDVVARRDPKAVRRILLCSGKVYVDIASARQRGEIDPRLSARVAIVRLEELYPFPAHQIEQVVASYPNVAEMAWLQEEPRNMGAWTFVAPRLRDILGGRWPLRYMGRPRRASPAEGSYEWHLREQGRVVLAAFELPEAERERQSEVQRGG